MTAKRIGAARWSPRYHAVAAARFAALTKRGAPSECWPWLGHVDADGYGRFAFRGKRLQAHQFAWRRARGPIPKGKQLDHLCRNRACVNVAHLEPVTSPENTRRGIVARQQEVGAMVTCE